MIILYWFIYTIGVIISSYTFCTGLVDCKGIKEIKPLNVFLMLGGVALTIGTILFWYYILYK